MRQNPVTTKSRGGVAAVETAVVLPILVVLLLGLWDIGRMIEAQQVLSNAAREGARLASTGNANGTATPTNTMLPTAHYADIQAIVTQYIADAKLNTANLVVNVNNLTAGGGPSYDPTTASPGDAIQVQAVLPFDNVRWVLLNKTFNTATITGSSTWMSALDVPVQISTTLPGG